MHCLFLNAAEVVVTLDAPKAGLGDSGLFVLAAVLKLNKYTSKNQT